MTDSRESGDAAACIVASTAAQTQMDQEMPDAPIQGFQVEYFIPERWKM